MSTRDRIDDRQPETRAPARARFVRAGESLEGARKKGRREPVPLVEDVELDVPVLLGAGDPDGSGPVLQCVRDEVAERLLEANPVTREPEPGGDVDFDWPPAYREALRRPRRRGVRQRSAPAGA